MAELIRWVPEGNAVVTQALQLGPSMRLSDYQAAVAAQISSESTVDGNTGTIYGYPPDVYFFLGAQQEFGETLEIDRETPTYNRMRALFIRPGDSYRPATPETVHMHRQEFGDLSWYVANALQLNGVPLDEAPGIEPGTTLADLDYAALEYAADNRTMYIFPGVYYRSVAHEFLGAHELWLRTGGETAHRMFYRSAGKLIIAMSVLLQLRLDCGLAEVLPANLAKIERRIGIGNIFDTGDAR